MARTSPPAAARQLAEDDKAQRADHVYVNDTTPDDLEAWVAERFAEYTGDGEA